MKTRRTRREKKIVSMTIPFMQNDMVKSKVIFLNYKVYMCALHALCKQSNRNSAPVHTHYPHSTWHNLSPQQISTEHQLCFTLCLSPFRSSFFVQSLQYTTQLFSCFLSILFIRFTNTQNIWFQFWQKGGHQPILISPNFSSATMLGFPVIFHHIYLKSIFYSLYDYTSLAIPSGHLHRPYECFARENPNWKSWFCIFI